MKKWLIDSTFIILGVNEVGFQVEAPGYMFLEADYIHI